MKYTIKEVDINLIDAKIDIDKFYGKDLKLPVTQHVCVDNNYKLLNGYHRFKFFKDSGMKTIVVCIVDLE